MGRTRTREAIILAGGFGTRLRGVLADLPKPMAPVAGRPFLEWQLEALARRGIERVVLSVGYRSAAISTHFGAAFGGMALVYAVETEPLGTGGAIAAAFAAIEGPAAFVLNGDTYIRAPLGRLDDIEGCPVCLLVARVADAGRFGTVSVAEGRVTGFHEKGAVGPGLVNSGVYRIERSVLRDAGLAAPFSFERDFLERAVGSMPIGALVTDEPFVDIGVPESLAFAGDEIPALAAADSGPFG